MLTTLMESARQRKPNRSGTIVSTVFHSALIAAAVYATASGAVGDAVAKAPDQTTVHWARPNAAPASPAPKPAPKPKPTKKLVAPDKIPTTTPPSTATETVEPSYSPPNADTAGSGTGPRSYGAWEVEVEVVAIASSIRPQYPDPLRSSGVEGQVVAEFVVNEKGRADRESLRILSSTHKLFADAVSRALPQMRFKPAKIGGKPVSQLVQQAFVFKLDR
ncbi:MAG TPA: energy transducer TonB [Gemmatimonadaceae bacterium]|jgi:protein TonB